MTTKPMMGMFAAAWVASVVNGCGSSSTPPASLADQACAVFAQATCQKTSTCTSLTLADAGVTGTDGIGLVRVYGDMKTCLARQKLACTGRAGASGSGAQPSVIEQCAMMLGTTSCEDFSDNRLPVACVPAGTRAAGQACAVNAQCDTGFCSGTKNANCGTCAPLPAPGDSCAASGCGPGVNCVQSTMLCQTPGTSGAACGSDLPCGTGMTCVGDTATTMGTCQPAVATEGSACGGGMAGCENNVGLACLGAAGAKTCTKVSLVGDILSCGTLADGSRADCIGGGCYTATGQAAAADMGMCKSRAPDGASCDTVLGPSCMTPARCVVVDGGTAGVCTVPNASTCG